MNPDDITAAVAWLHDNGVGSISPSMGMALLNVRNQIDKGLRTNPPAADAAREVLTHLRDSMHMVVQVAALHQGLVIAEFERLITGGDDGDRGDGHA